MTSQNSFGAAGKLNAGGRDLRDFSPRGAGKSRDRQALAHPLLDQDSSREPAALRRRHHRQALRHRIRRASGTPRPPRRRSTSARRACCCRISPACPAWSISPRCATPCTKMGADPKKANPLIPVDLVIDHSVQVDEFGTKRRLRRRTRCSNSSAIRSAMRSCAGDNRRSGISAPCRPIRASCTR